MKIKRSVLNNAGAELDSLKAIKFGKLSSQEEKVNANLEMQKISFELTNIMFPIPKEL